MSFIACNSPYTDKVSIGSSCSRSRSRSIEKSTNPPLTETNNEENNESISIDITGTNLLESQDGSDDKPKKMTATEILRSVFFRLNPVEIQKLDSSPKKSDSTGTDTVTITQENKIQPFNNSHTSIYNKNIGKSIYVENSSL